MTQHGQVPVSENSPLRANPASMEPDANDSEPPAKETEVAEAVAQTLSGAETSPALRESQIQNAVSFLGHPKVCGLIDHCCNLSLKESAFSLSQSVV